MANAYMPKAIQNVLIRENVICDDEIFEHQRIDRACRTLRRLGPPIRENA